MAPDGKPDGEDAEFEEAVRLTAYFLWEQAGKPPGREEDYWLAAREQHLRQRAYDLWLASGAPDGDADRHWFEAEQKEQG